MSGKKIIDGLKEAVEYAKGHSPMNLKEQVAREAQAKKLIENERYRQITAEGWTAEHDDAHQEGELLRASVAYYVAAKHGGEFVENAYNWPWDKRWWKPKSPPRNLEIAGALALAERDRLKRKHGHAANTGPADHKYEQAVKLLTALLHPEGSSADVVERAKPVAWRCKDFGDGWIVYQYKEHADRYQKETGCLMQPLFASAQPSNARERASEEALKRIATDDCGCTPICQCNSESALRVWKEETQQIAKAALRTPDVERPASPVPAGEDEAAWKAFGASEAACIHYPDDTELDRACRAAYIRGAADSAPSLPEWKAIETAVIADIDRWLTEYFARDSASSFKEAVALLARIHGRTIDATVLNKPAAPTGEEPNK